MADGHAPRPRKDIWRLDAAERADAADQYRLSCAKLFDIELADGDAAFRNELIGYNLAGAIFARCRGVAQRFTRTQAHIQSGNADVLYVVLNEAGTWVGDYGGRKGDRSLGPIRLIDMRRPFTSLNEPFQTLNLVMPLSSLGAAADHDFHGVVVPDNSATGRLLAAQMRTLFDTAESLTLEEAEASVRALIALVAGVITAHAPRSSASPNLLNTARTFIDARLDDAELTPEAVRAHLGLTRTRLYEAFGTVGGVGKFIQARRLDHAFDAVVDPAQRRTSLAQIAYAHGFRSDAHFNRAFRTRFGMRPGALRGLGPVEAPSAARNPDDVFAWLQRF